MKDGELTAALEQLAREHETAARSYRLACVAGAWQFVTQPEYAPWLKALVGVKARPPRLSQPALETLAIIAYRQPITRAEVEQIRGVNVDGMMQTLMERGLVEAVGPRRSRGPPADLRHDGVVPRILRLAQPGRFARRGRTPPHCRRKTAWPGHGRSRSGHDAAGATCAIRAGRPESGDGAGKPEPRQLESIGRLDVDVAGVGRRFASETDLILQSSFCILPGL